MSKNPIIMTGLQPSGIMHIGNYFGAIENFVNVHKKLDSVGIVMLADLHSLNNCPKPEELRKNVLHLVATLLACFEKTPNITMFLQSMVPAHAELATMLGSIAKIGELERMTQFKDKKQKIKEGFIGAAIAQEILSKKGRLEGSESFTVSFREEEQGTDAAVHFDATKKSIIVSGNGFPLGLLSYPVLQAADILLYGTTHVPVGDDQKQHLELTSKLAGRFNHRYGQIFAEPEPVINSRRIMSLSDGTKKMSKTDPKQSSCILLTDTDDEIASKIKVAKTDSIKEVYFDESRPEIANLIRIFSYLSNQPVEEIRYESSSAFKAVLTEALVAKIAPIRTKIIQYQQDEEFLITQLKNGSAMATKLAIPLITKAKNAMGLLC